MTCSHSMMEVGYVTLQLYDCAAFSATPPPPTKEKNMPSIGFEYRAFCTNGIPMITTERVVLNAYGVVTDLR